MAKGIECDKGGGDARLGLGLFGSLAALVLVMEGYHLVTEASSVDEQVEAIQHDNNEVRVGLGALGYDDINDLILVPDGDEEDNRPDRTFSFTTTLEDAPNHCDGQYKIEDDKALIVVGTVACQATSEG
jgi:hypothetical protein